MKNNYRQTSVGWCAPITLANVFKMEEFMQYVNDEKFKGCTTEEVKIMLKQALDRSYTITTIMEVHENFGSLPVDLVWDALVKDEQDLFMHVEERCPVIPYFLSIKLSKDFFHFIAILKIKQRLFYVDPYKEDVLEITSKKELANQFIQVNLIERLAMETEEGLKYVCIHGDRLGYESLLSKT